ncbi:hypothetical protein NFB50_16105 [Yersinia ruckeri]|uniref:hypothetical protein n=1 Tax=Yersinia ruckeri TaxID=29486 RepID=UPI0020BF1633|nr:hypothetical protein [Yersinia ruckeri]HDL6787548.1 hypothetical protein [Yersinia enterocolitica]MCW6559981.1 hypothetical protein [Yersinia ruckeri]MCW6596016.1 hypothetical protein [Yersinia ruckeri]UZY16856.1 hypothetical protein LNQ37_017910 [Yersinia ruckeri]HDM8387211.1 hypothetical protein [Yersinia enterocolitica]
MEQEIMKLAKQLPVGYAIVPICPTETMLKSGQDELKLANVESNQDDVCFCFQAMIQNYINEQTR